MSLLSLRLIGTSEPRARVQSGLSQAPTLESDKPTSLANEDCGMTFFRGVLCALMLSSVFWSLVAAVLLID